MSCSPVLPPPRYSCVRICMFVCLVYICVCLYSFLLPEFGEIKWILCADAVEDGCWQSIELTKEQTSRWADEEGFSWSCHHASADEGWGALAGCSWSQLHATLSVACVKCDATPTATVNFASCSVPNLLTTLMTGLMHLNQHTSYNLSRCIISSSYFRDYLFLNYDNWATIIV